MFNNAITLNTVAHAKKAVKKYDDFSFARDVTSAPLGWSEIQKASRSHPVVFTSEGPLVPVALLGFTRDESVCVDEHGNWNGSYVPAHIRRYPFVLGDTDEGTEFTIMVAEEALTEETEDRRLFSDSGEEGEVVKSAREFLISFQKEILRAEKLCSGLREQDVLVDRSLHLKQDGKSSGTVQGVQIVDKERLDELPDTILAEWVRSGLMELITLHLNSISNYTFQGPRS